MFRKDPVALACRLPAHCQKQLRRIDIDRAHGGAQSAKAAFKRQSLVLVFKRIEGVGDFLGLAVFCQECAFLLA